MSMHLVGPWLTTTGKKKGKKKWRSAEHKRKFEEYQQYREELDKEFGLTKVTKSKNVKTTWNPEPPPPRRADNNIPSLTSNWNPCLKKDPLFYTGTKLKGIATMHKSNMVPIFSEEEAVEVARMRRG